MIISPIIPITFENSGQYELLPVSEYLNSKISKITINCEKIVKYDSFMIVYFHSIEKLCQSKEILFETIGMNSQLLRFFKFLKIENDDQKKQPEQVSFVLRFFEHIGEISTTIIKDIKLFIEFIGEIILKTLIALIKPGNLRWKDLPYHFVRSGVNALPIVLLIIFLIGLVTGYQASRQLHQFGADIFIADLIGISITRELAPLMTAILIAGRSGSSFAAEIGTMVVSEEIAALTSLGKDLSNFIVLPRVLAVVLAMPLLVVFADITGILGGLVMSMISLDMPITTFLNELQKSLSILDILSGLVKSIMFGFLIASVGCFRGLQVKASAESVGHFTTISVVSGVLAIIVSDAILTIIFQIIGF
ncbi:MAG: ABC transporter permease [Candidatus Kapabacteria bacterium]|nr:ABC transporter permease [Candidatus Kapabacteria bacterium]